MLEQLGIGVVLSMEDDFTPQANNALGSFERLQAGAESMVSGIEKNMLQMRNLMMTGFTFQQMGEGIENFGQKINKTFENMYEGTVKAGAHWETLKATLNTFYKEQTDNVMQQGLQLASKTPFEVDDVMTSIKSLKAVKMEALKTYDEIDNAGQHYKKTFLEYVGDLGAFNPQQGINGAMTALRNLIGGSKRSLDQRFDVNSEYLLGEKWSTEPMKIQEQFKTFMGKLAPNMMKNLEGTFDQLMSNMHDKWTMFKIDIADAGVFKPVKDTLKYVSERMDTAFSDGTVKKFAGVLGQALGALWTPIDLVIKGVTEITIAFAHFSEYHPVIAKIALALLAVAGATLTVTGFVMKMAGSFLLAVSSFAMLYMNMQLMTLQGVTLSSMFVGLGGAVRGFVASMGIIGLAGAGIFYAWQKDLDGFRTNTMATFSGIVSNWQNAVRAIHDSNFRTALMEALGGNGKNLDMKFHIKLPPLASIFAGKFLKILAITKAFWQVFTGTFDKGKMHFSKADWDLYKDMGIAGLVQGLVYARDKIDHFFKGFTDGLTVAYGVIKTFVEFIVAPLKSAYDDFMVYLKDNPNGIVGSLFLGKNGVDIGSANEAVQMAERLGKAVGAVVGALVGMKVVSGLSKMIASPFVSLYNNLAKVGTKIDSIKAKIAGVGSGGIGGIVTKITGNKKTGKYASDVARDLGAYTSKNARVSTYRKGQAFRDGKYQNLNPKNIDPTFHDYFMRDQANGRQIQTKRRSTVGRMLLGEDYYAKNTDGSREKLGRYGGVLRMNREDKNINNRATQLFARNPMMRENTPEWLTHRPVIGDTVGQLKHMKGIEALQSEQALKQASVRSTARSITGLSNSQFDRYSSIRQKSINSDYQGLSKKAWDKSITDKEMERLRSYNTLGYNGNAEEFDRNNHGTAGARGIYSQLKGQRASSALANSSQYQDVVRKAGAGSLNQNVYADAKQGSLSRLLTGQRLYTVTEGKNGEYNQNVVGRRGGVFNRSNANVYNPEKATLGARVRNSALGTRVSAIGNSAVVRKVSSVAGGVTARARGLGSTLATPFSFMGGKLNRGASAVGGWYNKQRERVGLAPRVPRESTTLRQKVGGAVRGTGRALFGSNIRDAEGSVIGRRQGLIGKGAGMARGVGGGLMRGVGAVGGLAMRALPMAMMGSMAFGAIANKGKSVSAKDRQSMGVGKDASNFQVGLKSFQQSLSKVNFTQLWGKLKKEGGACFKIIGQMAKSVFVGLKSILPSVMSSAWAGIKAMASLAWTWIKTDGVKVMSSIGSSIMSVLGKAWQWVCANGGKMIGQLAVFIIGTVLPKIVAGIVQLGVFIITHIPAVLKGLVQIALGIFKEIYEGVKSIFSGIASFIANAFTSAIAGAKGAILGALGSIVGSIPGVGGTIAKTLGLPTHHGGLWLSDMEHMAVIRKDETVLPPDKSKMLNDALTGGAPRKSSGIVKSGDTHNSSSIKIDKVEVTVQAENLSRSDARKQALLIIDELKKIKREKSVRNYKDIDSSDLAL